MSLDSKAVPLLLLFAENRLNLYSGFSVPNVLFFVFIYLFFMSIYLICLVGLNTSYFESLFQL